MAITHTETVSDLIVLNDGTDVVSQVVIKTVSVDDSNPSKLTKTTSNTYFVDAEGGTGASGFIAYDSLSEDVVKGWIADELAESTVKTNAEAWIESKKNPPAPPEVSKTLPW
tara:strand:- start:1249 stop:1584 length:336 start_codon:yes stop_codon:yes gene_type:complete